MTDTHGPTCLHCRLWSVIHKFCDEHPNGCVEDILIALADVASDILMFKRALPVQDKLLSEFNECIRERTDHVYQLRGGEDK